MVGTDNQPEAVVGANSYFRAVMEEHANIVMFIFFLGIIAGIIISVICYYIYKFIKSSKNEENTNAEKTEPEENTNIPKTEEDRFESKFIIGFIVIMVLICAIAVGVAVSRSNKDEDTPISESRNATLDDIYTKITTISDENRTIEVQASEKIKELVIEVRFVDKNGRILKTQEIEVGNISPGNEFTYKLTRDGMQISDLDKINSFKIRVTGGTIEE